MMIIYDLRLGKTVKCMWFSGQWKCDKILFFVFFYVSSGSFRTGTLSDVRYFDRRALGVGTEWLLSMIK